jgi:hypothetical protein
MLTSGSSGTIARGLCQVIGERSVTRCSQDWALTTRRIRYRELKEPLYCQKYLPCEKLRSNYGLVILFAGKTPYIDADHIEAARVCPVDGWTAV